MPSHLYVIAELTDDAVYTEATGFNEPLWTLGDAFEMFLKPPGEGYYEFHVAPGNRVMQLRFPDGETIRALRAESDDLANYFVPDSIFTSAVETTPTGWRIEATIPHGSIVSGALWRFSFSRYDATPGTKEAVVSSTSPHTVLDFHDQSAWGTMIFSNV